MDKRQTHVAQPGGQNRLQPVEAVERYAAVAAPILANGDMTGAVCMVQPETGAVLSERTSSWRRSLPLFSENSSKNEKAPPAKRVEPFC